MSDLNKNENITNESDKEEIILHKPSPKEKFKKASLLVKILIYISAILVLSGILFAAGLLWQWRFDLLAICNAFYFSATIFIAFAVIILAANNNVFAPLVYGTKTFFLMFAGKKPKLSYYDYCLKNKENQIANIYIFFPLIASIPNLIIAIILHFIYNTQVFPYL